MGQFLAVDDASIAVASRYTERGPGQGLAWCSGCSGGFAELQTCWHVGGSVGDMLAGWMLWSCSGAHLPRTWSGMVDELADCSMLTSIRYKCAISILTLEAQQLFPEDRLLAKHSYVQQVRRRSLDICTTQ